MIRLYESLTREDLERRLALAEAVCLTYGWSPSRHETEREKACHELWTAWLASVPPDFTRPQAHPELSDEVVHALAAERDATRARTLARIRGDKSVHASGQTS